MDPEQVPHAILKSAEVSSVPEVIGVMQAVADWLPAADGLARFNFLYMETTREIQTALNQGRFQQPDFVSLLDVEFAKLYFSAVRAVALTDAQELPRVWRVLLAARHHTTRIHAYQFALAGMNAHINHDLPSALFGLWSSLDLDPEDPVQRADYDLINQILEVTSARVKAAYETAMLAEIDKMCGSLDDRLALFSVAKARDTAWLNGCILRGLPAYLRDRYVKQLDRSFGLVGSMLLAEQRG